MLSAGQSVRPEQEVKSPQQEKVIQPYSPLSYALMYAIAVGLLGTEKVHYYVGMEPSGRYHNELCLDYNSTLL